MGPLIPGTGRVVPGRVARQDVYPSKSEKETALERGGHALVKPVRID